MWVEFMTVRNAYLAQTWQELFAAEGLSVRVIPPIGFGEAASLRDSGASNSSPPRPCSSTICRSYTWAAP